MPDVSSQRRVHDMLLGPLERPALQWLARHTPRRMTPDTMTLIGILGSIVIFVGYALCRFSPAYLWLASVGFVLNWYGDSLDGTLARYRKIERPRFGFFVDHTVDAFSQVMVFLGLGFSPYVRLDIAALGLVGYLLMTIVAYVHAFVTGTFRISYARIGPTEMRLIAVLINAAVFFFGNPSFNLLQRSITLFDAAVMIIAVALMVAFAVTSLRYASSLVGIDSTPES
ncbi:MAG: CDP-alcohol phosphatidyltransferase family protein [Anaerolineales bacterium]